MGKKDPRVDAYIEKSQTFAQPILRHIRKLVHKNCPDAQETIKWGFPHFDYRGPLCFMASFKQHCTFGFWKGDLVLGDDKRHDAETGTAMGQFGRIAKRSDLPADDVLGAYIQKAAELNEAGIKTPSRSKPKEPVKVSVPADLSAALKQNKQAQNAFKRFTPGYQKEYVEWIAEAKSEATRQKRLAQAIEWIAEGKTRNWKYMRK